MVAIPTTLARIIATATAAKNTLVTLATAFFRSPDTRGGTVYHVTAATIEHGATPVFRDRPAVA